jgi:hypothetical protein
MGLPRAHTLEVLTGDALVIIKCEALQTTTNLLDQHYRNVYRRSVAALGGRRLDGARMRPVT